MDPIRPGLGEAALSHMIQPQRLTATRRRDSQEPFVVRLWAPPQRTRSFSKIYINKLQPQRRQEAVQDQDYDADQKGKKLESRGPDREEPLLVNLGQRLLAPDQTQSLQGQTLWRWTQQSLG